ncbi:hypothetical protein NE645_17425, partial [Roseburia hominis]|nr:hypothetical protein [Roseburia hominis]
DFQALLKKVMISLGLLLILASLGTEFDWMSLLSCLILGGLEISQLRCLLNRVEMGKDIVLVMLCKWHQLHGNQINKQQCQ